MQREVIRVETPDELAETAAGRFVALGRAAIEQRGIFSVALSGGSTPRALYQQLAGGLWNDALDWSRVQVYFSDERFVPPDSSESNYHTAREFLFDHVPLAADNIHAYRTVDISPSDSAERYESEIRAVLGAGDDGRPVFDLILLGMGPDGHTASLFPGTTALEVKDRIVAPNFVEKFETWRLTFTYPLLDAARTVMFLVQGADKKERVREVLSGTSSLPAARVHPAVGQIIWMLDAAAASGLETGHPSRLRSAQDTAS